MTLEQGKVRVPDYPRLWRRLTLQSEEGLFTEEEQRPLQIREATHDLILTLRAMLFDPTLENDTQHRLVLMDLCSQTCATLADMGVEKDAAVGKDEDRQQTPLQIAIFAAGLLVGEDFATIPTQTTYLLEVQEQACSVNEIKEGEKIQRFYKVRPENLTKGIRRWLDMFHKVERVERLLAF